MSTQQQPRDQEETVLHWPELQPVIARLTAKLNAGGSVSSWASNSDEERRERTSRIIILRAAKTLLNSANHNDIVDNDHLGWALATVRQAYEGPYKSEPDAATMVAIMNKIAADTEISLEQSLPTPTHVSEELKKTLSLFAPQEANGRAV